MGLSGPVRLSLLLGYICGLRSGGSPICRVSSLVAVVGQDKNTREADGCPVSEGRRACVSSIVCFYNIVKSTHNIAGCEMSESRSYSGEKKSSLLEGHKKVVALSTLPAVLPSKCATRLGRSHRSRKSKLQPTFLVSKKKHASESDPAPVDDVT